MKNLLGNFTILALAIPTLCIAQTPPQTCAEAKRSFDGVYGAPWTEIQKRFGTPAQVEENKPYSGYTLLRYSFPGCVIEFTIFNGDVSSKNYRLGAAAFSSLKGSDLLPSGSTSAQSALFTPAAVLAPGATTPQANAFEPPPTPAPPSALTAPLCAENGSCYGDISNITGRPKTVQVNGYYRKDGTYVRGYYRSK